MNWRIGFTGVFVLLFLPCVVSSAFSVDSLRLLLAIQEGPGSGSFDLTVDRPTQGSPEWPVHTFLVAEYFHQRGQWRRAQEEYRRLVDWSVADECGDKRGGSGLAGIALWRLLQGKPEEIAQDERHAEYLLEQGEKLLNKRAVKGLFSVPWVRTRLVLARFADDILRQLVAIAMHREDHERMMRLFQKSLEARTTGGFSSADQALLEKAADEGRVASSKVALSLGKRLRKLGEHEGAGRWLEKVLEHGETGDLRTEAGFELAELRQTVRRPRKEVIALLDRVVREMDDTVPKTLQQEVLFRRGIRHNREGVGRDVDRAREDFETILRKFPKGRRVDDALLELARSYEWAGRVQRALSYYDALKKLKWRHGKRDSMHFRPALLQYALGGLENLAKAKTELEVLEKWGSRRALYIPALFWLGRLYEESGDGFSADEYFRRIINARGDKIDYYAIRARMHINAGRRASKLLFPDEVTERELKGLYAQSSRSLRDHDVRERCPYAGRVSWAVWTGLYAKALEGGQQRLTHRGVSVEQRQDPSFLDQIGALTSVVIHVSLQQDAVRAGVREARARVAWQLTQAGDPTGGLAVVSGGGRRSQEWLAAAYPPVYVQPTQDSGKEHSVLPELLYGVIRRESRFSPAAVSGAGALGLFQFLPSTFEDLNERWNLLDDARGAVLEGYLSEPKASVELGARWFQDLLLRRAKGGDGQRELLAVMEHNAGPEAVDAWLSQWKAVGRDDDVEYMVVAARFGQTRHFLRAVISSMAIARAAGMFSRTDG